MIFMRDKINHESKYLYSFIIPHHNSPSLLTRLLNSIPQRNDIEIIVVDDNSDEDKIAHSNRNDVKIIMIDKEQSRGAGKARNVGLNAASGKWLLFADADDFYKPGFLEILDEYKNDDIDILFFNVDSVDSDTLQADKQNRCLQQQILIEQYNGSKETTDVLLFFGGAPWRRMLRREFVQYYGFKYEETSVHNDIFFALQASYFSKKIKVEKRILYTLTYCAGSITYGRMTKNKILDKLKLLGKKKAFYNFIGHPEWNVKSFEGYHKQSIVIYIYSYFKKRNFILGLKSIIYYFIYWQEINKSSMYYVDTIKNIQQRVNYHE